METMLALLVVHFCLRFIHGLQSRGSSDHCYYDRFEPRCDDDEVIVIINALYGRMKFGRCVKTNFGYIGCYDDVIHLIQERCLGRRECNVEVVEPTFPGLKPCNDELKSYLEVEYACVKELLPEDPTTCDLRLELNVAALTPDVIMTSSLFGGVTCGDDQSPFRVKVDPGQRINVSMVTLLSSDQSESENVNRKRSIFISHDYVMEYRDDDGDDDDDENKNSYSASYYGVDLDEGANDDDGYGEGGDDDDLEPNDVISGRTETFHFARVRSTSLTNSASSSIPSSLIKSSSSSSSSLVSSVPSVVASLNESSLVPSSSSSSSRSSSVATCRSATPRPFIASSSTSSSTSSSSSSSSSSSLSSGEVIRHKSSRDGHRRFRRGLKSLHLISKRHEPKQCRQMGRIVESQLPQSETSELCGGRSHKLYHVTTSQSNSLEIYLAGRRERFMLLFKVIGCPDIRVDQSTTRIAYARDRATAEVTCLLRHQTWLITCRENRWVGFMEGNCSGAMEFFEEASKSPGVQKSFKLNSVLVVVIVTGVSGAISLFVLAIGLLIFKRFRSHANQLGESELVKYPISLKDAAYTSSSPSEGFDPTDDKPRPSFLTNGHLAQPNCVCQGSNPRDDRELGNKIFSLKIPSANLSEFSMWDDKLDQGHVDRTQPGRCHGREGSALCIECLANERKTIAASPFDLAPISTKQ